MTDLFSVKQRISIVEKEIAHREAKIASLESLKSEWVNRLQELDLLIINADFKRQFFKLGPKPQTVQPFQEPEDYASKIDELQLKRAELLTKINK